MTDAPDVGAKAPDFSLPSDDRGQITLSGLAGQIVVLYFYPKDDTSGCTRQARDFTDLAAAFAAEGAEVVGVSPDSVKRHASFRDKHSLSVALASDVETSTLQAYGVWREKSMYGRKFMGVERSTFLIGGDGCIRQVWRKVKVPGHAEEVLAAVRELARKEQ